MVAFIDFYFTGPAMKQNQHFNAEFISCCCINIASTNVFRMQYVLCKLNTTSGCRNFTSIWMLRLTSIMPNNWTISVCVKIILFYVNSNIIWAVSRQNQHNGFVTSMDPDQPAQPRSLIRIHAVRYLYQFLYLLYGL
jgi:hypothetical protein